MQIQFILLVRQMEIGNSGNYAPPKIEDPFAMNLKLDLDKVAKQKEDIVKQVEAMVSTEA